MLKLQFKDQRREAIWLVDRTFSIGKNPTNSLMIEESEVNDFHAEITNDKDQLTLTNKSTDRSLWINGKRVKGQTKIQAGDVITIGSIDLELVDPKLRAKHPGEPKIKPNTHNWAIRSSASWLEQNHFPINGKIIIGRDPDCDVALPLKHLSRQHVEFEVRSGQLYVKDLDSSNGTFLNGSQITESIVKPGDKIKLDVITFEVEGPASDPNKTIIRTVAPKRQKTTPARKKPETKLHSTTERKLKVPSEKDNENKRLVADGKQKWISGNSLHETPRKSKMGMLLLITSGILALASATIFISFYF